jgi:hypothetical protein
VLLTAALWAARIDFASAYERNSAPLEWLAVGSKAGAAMGLTLVARRIRSRSIGLLAILLAALVVGSFLVDVDWFDSAVGVVSSRLEEVLPVSAGFLELAGLFVALAIVAIWLVSAAYRAATSAEIVTVRVLLGLIFIVGVFVGPINAISALGINREWLFAEDFGQAVSLAFLVGYVSALVVATRESSSRGD